MADGLNSYIEFLVDGTKAKVQEKQKKFSWMNEILLLIIAYMQVAPTLYDLLCGKIPKVEPVQTIIMIAILLFGVIFIIRKE